MSEIIPGAGLQKRKLTAEHGALFVAAALFLTILSPFGTDSQFTLPLRFVYWFGVILGGTAIGLAVSIALPRRRKPPGRSGTVLLVSARVLTASIPVTLLVAGMEMWLRAPLGWAALPELYIYVVTITGVITTASFLVEQHMSLKTGAGTGSQVALPSSGSRTPTPFHSRLDPRLRDGEIRLLKAEDHYLRVGTSKGTALIRCTMGIAADELAPLDGRRVHRSWWVARSSVLKAERKAGGWRLITKDGEAVPVSRGLYRELAESNWLPR